MQGRKQFLGRVVLRFRLSETSRGRSATDYLPRPGGPGWGGQRWERGYPGACPAPGG